MPNTMISEYVDIYSLPEVDKEHVGDKNTNITIGDLHGNAIKLLFMLIKHGIASELSKEDYKELVAIYKQSPEEITSENLNTFDALIAKIEIKADASIILIGDVLCDRGSNDYFTLKLLDKLFQGGAHVETLLSNHDADFIMSYETKARLQTHTLIGNIGQTHSMEALQMLIDRKLITNTSVRQLFISAYQPTLRALTYTLSGDANEITIYSHAPIDLDSLQAIAKKIKIRYEDTSIKNLAETIDAINSKFQEHAQNNTIHTLYDYENVEREAEEAPFEHLMWNRNRDNLKRPAERNSYSISFVHGHDTDEWFECQFAKEHIYNLDNKLGKNKDKNKGQYNVLYTESEKLRLVPQEQYKKLDQEFLKTKESKAFLTQMESLFNKAVVFEEKGETNPAEAALKIYRGLHTAFYDYAKNPNDEQAKAAFKDSCQEQFASDERKELETHRGAKKTLVNLAIAIGCLLTTLGIAIIPLGLGNLAWTHGKHFWYHPKTDSALKIDALEQSVEKFGSNTKT